MSIASEIARLYAERENNRLAIVAKGVSVPTGTPLAGLPAYIAAISGGSATAPAAFVSGYWTATQGNNQIVVNITSLPSTGGSAITSIQYRLNGGTVVTFAGAGTGSRTISGLTNGTAYDVEIRAVNAIGNGPWSDVKTRTPEAPTGSIIETLLAASTFGFVLSPNDTAVTRCYVETTGLSATTLCTEGQDIGTIRCMVTSRVITFPTGVKPVFRDNGTRKWIQTTSTTAKMLWTAGSAFTGAGPMLMAMAGVRATVVSGSAPVMASATLNDGAFWEASTRGGLQHSGLAMDIVRDAYGGPVPSVGVNDGERFALAVGFGSTSTPYSFIKGVTPTVGALTHGASGSWNVNQAYLGTSNETAKYEGEICFCAVLNVSTADLPTLIADVRTYMQANSGL